MCIGSLTCWNFGKRVRSRNFHYPLHTLTTKEKVNAVALYWQQHTDAMLQLEGNVLSVNGQQVTVEFHLSADQAWQFWANNELTQSSTYPSMYAKVHKSEHIKIGGVIGKDWEVPTAESIYCYLTNIASHWIQKKLSQDNYHKKELQFMADNCVPAWPTMYWGLCKSPNGRSSSFVGQ